MATEPIGSARLYDEIDRKVLRLAGCFDAEPEGLLETSVNSREYSQKRAPAVPVRPEMAADILQNSGPGTLQPEILDREHIVNSIRFDMILIESGTPPRLCGDVLRAHVGRSQRAFPMLVS